MKPNSANTDDSSYLTLCHILHQPKRHFLNTFTGILTLLSYKQLPFIRNMASQVLVKRPKRRQGHQYLDLNTMAKDSSKFPAFLAKDLGEFETLRPIFEAVSLAIKEQSSSSCERVSGLRAVAQMTTSLIVLVGLPGNRPQQFDGHSNA
jgi:hypothetical protein